MHAQSHAANPFALLTDPEAIFRAVEASPRLESLSRRICRPLDRAQRGEDGAEGQEASSLDVVVEQDAARFYE